MGLDVTIATFQPIMDQLMSQVNGTVRLIHDAEREGRDYTDLIAHREANAVAWLHYYETIESKHRDYLLALRIEELLQPAEIKRTVDEGLQKAVDELHEKFAKIIAKLFDPKGHEAMYGAT